MCKVAKVASGGRRAPVVGELQFAKVRQCGETFERCQADVDQAEGLERREFIGKANNIRAATIVQDQFGHL